ncbi:MAG TPA: hypothetical protein GXZ26_02205 [Firmicutes bacterium]|jgi:vacuolar-type H+-ATPase subunit H|nr:hypothetical protein [Bacillota bacterium]
MTRIHFLLLLDRLEEIVTKSPRFAGRSLVLKDEFLELLDKIRLTLPPEVKKADKIISEREEYIKKAREEAERIIREATQRAEQLLSEHYLIREAEEEAERITATADEYARQVRAELSQYVNGILNKLENHLIQVLQILRHVRKEFSTEEKKEEDE